MSDVNEAIKQAQEALNGRKNDIDAPDVTQEERHQPASDEDSGESSTLLLSGEDDVTVNEDSNPSAISKIDSIPTIYKIAALLAIGVVAFFSTLNNELDQNLNGPNDTTELTVQAPIQEDDVPGEDSINSILNNDVVTVEKETVTYDFGSDLADDPVAIENEISPDVVEDNTGALDFNTGISFENDISADNDLFIEVDEPVDSIVEDTIEDSVIGITKKPDELESLVIDTSTVDLPVDDINSTERTQFNDKKTNVDTAAILETIKKQTTLIESLSKKIENIKVEKSQDHVYAPNIDLLYIAPASRHCDTCTTHAVIMYKGDKLHIADKEEFKGYKVAITDDRLKLMDMKSGIEFSYWPIRE